MPALVVETGGVQRLLPLDWVSRYYRGRLSGAMFQKNLRCHVCL